MKATRTIFRRELGAYFNSPIAYVVVSVFLALSALLFFNLLFEHGDAEVRDLFSGFWPPLLFAIVGPAVAMRLLAEERGNDTLEVLLTMPVTDWQVVIAKYLAALMVFLFAMVMMGVFVATVAWLGPLDKGPVWTGFLGLFLTGALYIAIGLMTSSFTKNQIVAFIIAVLFCLLLWMIGKLIGFMPSNLQNILAWLGIDTHLDNLAKGVLETRDIVYFLSLIGLCLLITQTNLESRRWRS